MIPRPHLSHNIPTLLVIKAQILKQRGTVGKPLGPCWGSHRRKPVVSAASTIGSTSTVAHSRVSLLAIAETPCIFDDWRQFF